MTHYGKDGGYVYAIRHEHGFVKLGESTDPMDRLTSLSGATPYELYLYTTVSVIGDRAIVESHIHDWYADYRVSNEWFDLPDEDLAAMAEIDEVYQSAVEELGDWSFVEHIETPESELNELRSSVKEKEIAAEVAEVVELVSDGAMPLSSVNPDNAAMKNRAKKVRISPELFAERVNEKLNEQS